MCMRIAVIGTGIAGLSAAYLLSRKYDVTVFERNSYPGGHSNTVAVDTADGTINVDCGFVVFNHRNYPNLRRMLDELRVATFRSDVSYTISKRSPSDSLEFSSNWTQALLVNWRKLLSWRNWRLIKAIANFNRQALSDLNADFEDTFTLEDYIQHHKLAHDLVDLYLLPILGAIWPMPPHQMLGFPIKVLLYFLDHHGLLNTNCRQKWHSISQGSKSYINHLIRPLKDRIIYRPVVAVVRQTNGVLVTTLKEGGLEEQSFDQVVIATHADITANILKTKTSLEEELLSQFKYQENIGYLHQDPRVMPKNRHAWSSWNTLIYNENHPISQHSLSVTYWMNRLQNISNQHLLFVTFNPQTVPDKILRNLVYHHPLFDKQALAAQARLDEIQGKDRIWFCGGYFGYGFHEDALKSGIAVADALGAPVRWQ